MSGPSPREWHSEISSTQERAVALARAGAPPGTRVVAGRQTRGRGRLDRTWESPEGGLYLSLVLPRLPSPVALLPLALGAQIAVELERRFGVRLALKWPNDLLAVRPDRSARKVAGILVDRVVVPGGEGVAVAGIGVNVLPVARSLPPDLADRVASLGDLRTPPPTLDEVEELVVDAVATAVDSLGSEDGVRATRALCQERLYGVGRTATVDGTLKGTIAELGADGELLLDTGTHRVAIRAGDLRVEGTP